MPALLLVEDNDQTCEPFATRPCSGQGHRVVLLDSAAEAATLPMRSQARITGMLVCVHRNRLALSRR